jgi:hypothetical protein
VIAVTKQLATRLAVLFIGKKISMRAVILDENAKEKRKRINHPQVDLQGG